MKKKVLILGAGKIGTSIAKLLLRSERYELTLADISAKALGYVPSHPDLSTEVLDVLTDEVKLDKLIKRHDIAFSALSFRYNLPIAKSCAKFGTSYFDLTEDVETTKAVKKIAETARYGQIFMPQCGLAPGFVGIVGNDLAGRLDEVDSVYMRVGALPMFPSNMLKYNLTWSTEGLINEYCNPCEAILDGRSIEVLPLEGVENFLVDGIRYEAFNTSGGLGTLCETWKGKASNINYKSVRYQGHRELMRFLLQELNFNRNQAALRDILEAAIPMTMQDVVITFSAVTGRKDGRLVQITDARKVYHAHLFGEDWSAIQITTAAGACVAIDLFASGKLPQKGFIRQEDISLNQFISNRFGIYYDVMNDADVNVETADVVIEG